jgi:spermidine synthase
MLHILAEWRARQPREDFRVLVIGFGTSLLSVASQLVSNATVESVDIDDVMLREVAIPFFGYDAFHPRLLFQRQDCLDAVQLRAAAGLDFDAVLVDAFAMDGTVPLRCRSRDFVQAAAAMVARRQGLVIQNIWTRHFNSSFAKNVQENYEELLREYSSHFSTVQQQAFSVIPGPGHAHQLLIIGGSENHRFLPH